MKIAISSGHGLYIRGASGPPPWGLDEVDEARRVVDRVGELLHGAGVPVEIIHDNVSTNQDSNLAWLCSQHNAAFDGDHGDDRLDVSVHFNAYEVTTTQARGTEVWYQTQDDLAAEVASEIAMASGLIDRGGKYTNSLYFLSHTACKAILIEVAFVDSKPDADAYRQWFEAIAEAIAATISGREIDVPPLPEVPIERPPRPEPAPPEALFYARGRCSWFGGPADNGVSPEEGLAFIYSYEQRIDLFLQEQPPGTTGLARRLNSEGVYYLACRWDYQVTSKELLADKRSLALVRANNREQLAWPADWGPHEEDTGGRVADLSPCLMTALQITTDDVVEIIFPAPALTT